MYYKILNIFVLVAFLLSTSGFKISKHYCGNELVDLAVMSNADSCCDDGMCCNDEVNYYQFDYDSTFEIPKKLNLLFVDNIEFPIINLLLKTYEIEKEFSYTELPPPKTLSRKLSTLQSFLL